MRKRFLFGFFLGATMIFGGAQQFYGLKQNHNVSEKIYVSKNNDASEEEVIDVSSAQQFIDAITADKNINVVNDLDFSDIARDSYGIENYTKIINGNDHVIKNGNIFKDSVDNNQTYLFEHFNGEMHDLIFENFAFLIDQLGDATTEVVPDDFKISNIQLRNIEYHDKKIIIHAKDSKGISKLSQGIFINKAYSYGIKDVSIINSSISGIDYQIVDDYGPNVNSFRNGLITGIFIGTAEYINMQGTYLINNHFSNNTISTIFSNEEKTEYRNDKNPFTFGFSIGSISNSIIQDFFLNGNYITNNLFEVGRPRIGGAFGFTKNNSISRMYQTSLVFEGNHFNSFEGYVNDRLATLVGYDNGTKSSYQDVVVSELLTSSENINQGFDLATETNFAIDGSDFANLEYRVSISSSYYVSEDVSVRANNNLEYINFDRLTLDFWKEDVDYASPEANDLWNLTNLVNPDLSISTSGTGFPLFNKVIFVYNEYEFKNNQLWINFNSIIPESLETFTIGNIFNSNEYVIHKNTPFSLNTQIPEEQFDGLSDEQIQLRLNEWFWINAPEIPVQSKVVLMGPLTSLTPRIYQDPKAELNSELVTRSNYNSIEFSFVYSDESLVVKDKPEIDTFQIVSQDGASDIDLQNTNSFEVPQYLDPKDYNNFYQIQLDQSDIEFTYLANEGTSIELGTVQINGVLTNTDAFNNLPEPKLMLDTEFVQASDTLHLNLTMEDPNNLYIKDTSALENSSFTIHSPFKEFVDVSGASSYETTIKLSDFNFLDDSAFYDLNLAQTVFQNGDSVLNHYWIESDISLEYYKDLSYQKGLMNSPLLSGDIISANGDEMETYDPSKQFDAVVETNLDLEQAQIEVTFKEDNAFAYLDDYNINLDLIDANQVEHFHIDQSHNHFEFAIKQELVDYAIEMGVENVNLNDYYAIDYNSQVQSTITYVSEQGTKQVSELENWNNPEVANHNLNLRGALENTGEVDPVPSIDFPGNSSNEMSYWVIASLFLLIVTSAVLLALYSALKPNAQL